MPMTLNDLKRIFKVLGPNGAVAGLQASDIPDETIAEIAAKMKIALLVGSPRDISIKALVDGLVKADLKPTNELMMMSYDELVQYFADFGASNEDLMKIMKDLNYKVSAEDKKHLRRFVARQISETALFSNVALRAGDERRR